jgi:hypothetical protein
MTGSVENFALLAKHSCTFLRSWVHVDYQQVTGGCVASRVGDG